MTDFEQTINHIESIEKTWRHTLSPIQDQAHSFGRVPEDGNKVALWSVPRSTAEYLEIMARFAMPKTILELGCSAGYSTLFLARAAKDNNGMVYTTEILPKKISLAKKHFLQAGLSDVITLLEGDIRDIIQDWGEQKIDFVFMDADKERYTQYLDMLLPLMSENGLILVDNAGSVAMPDGSHVRSKHIEEFRKKVQSDRTLRSTYLPLDNGLLLIQQK